MDCTVEVNVMDKYPAVINHETETNHIIRLAKACIGTEHFSQQDLPLSAGEDFSFFLQAKPGCFFTLGTLKPGQKPMTLHSSNYNFNDDMIATGGYFWIKIVEDRLGASII
jgi:hippurate hydrolase